MTTYGSFELAVCATPEGKMVYTNNIYISQRQFVKMGNPEFVLVNEKIVYTVCVDERVPDGNIALNKFQRQSARGSANMPILVQQWIPDPDPHFASAYSCALEVNLAKRVVATVDAQELIDLLKKAYHGQVLSEKAVFVCEYFGTPVTLEVCNVTVMGGSQAVKYAKHAILSSETSIEITPANNKMLTFNAAESGSGPQIFDPKWRFADMGIGGLDDEFQGIFRRSFASRLFKPAVIAKLGIKHVKGMLLHGPPGTGKTLIARQIGKILAGREPKIVNGPEILNKFVGASEENIRELFLDAEEEWEDKKENSSLHIIIFDEIDAICKQRGSNRGGTGVHDTVVNQLLSKIDGVASPNNILVIGMTNRKDMIDSALLRPGRLEVHVEIGLPDEKGRVQILDIHTKKMRMNGYLADDVDIKHLASLTKNFSGAELEGLVKDATSYALYGSVDVTEGAVTALAEENICVKNEHFIHALDEVKAAFGAAEDTLKRYVTDQGLIDWGLPHKTVMATSEMLLNQVKNSQHTPLLSVLLQGNVGTGKTSIAAQLGLSSEFPFVKFISPDDMINFSEREKVEVIHKTFSDAYKSPISLIILDNIERLLEYVPIGARFSNIVLQALLVLVKKPPPMIDVSTVHNQEKKQPPMRKLMIVGTCASPTMLEDTQLKKAFNVILNVEEITEGEQVRTVFASVNAPVSSDELDLICENWDSPMGIKQLLMLIEMSTQNSPNGQITCAIFRTCMDDCGLNTGKARHVIPF